MAKTDNDTGRLTEEAVERLFISQLEEWPMFAENHARMLEAAEAAKTLAPAGISKTTDADDTAKRDRATDNDRPGGWNIEKRLLNHRKASAGAKTDAKSIASRACFLCKQNRPDEQKGLLWRDYEILVNPFPIADGHLTIPARSHTPQLIKGRVADMATLALLLPNRCLFYNGPRCGASAPDHFHFQAFERSMAANLTSQAIAMTELLRRDGARLLAPTPKSAPFPFFMIESDDIRAIEELFDRLHQHLPAAGPEPMMNIMMLACGDSVRACIVPRKAHRPSFYGLGEGQMLVSPASVEMLGCFVTSRQEDFRRFDADTVMQIYSELCLSRNEFETICNKL